MWFILHFFNHYDDDTYKKILINTNNDNLSSDEMSWRWDDWK